MRLFNTLTDSIETFEPTGEVTMYVCGVTPYDTTHLGHARTYLIFDLLVRHLINSGHRVKYVQNITDVDDSILKRAAETGETYRELGDRYISIFMEDIAALGMLPPIHFPRATRSIPEMQEMVRRLLATDHAYRVNGDIYFRVSSWEGFGRLSRLERERMLEIEAEQDLPTLGDKRKEDDLDFLLWRSARPGEPAWDSPWGPGRPGWHIECSTLALKHLGPQIDIHGGGEDLVYPHHECEIAQTEAATGAAPWVRFWVHVAMARLDGDKMSKSKGNMVFVRDLLETYSADALRLYLFSVHYRAPLDFEETELKRCARLAERVADAARVTTGRAPAEEEPTDAYPRLGDALDDDLDTPTALAILEETADELFELVDRGSPAFSSQRTLRRLAARLGLQLA